MFLITRLFRELQGDCLVVVISPRTLRLCDQSPASDGGPAAPVKESHCGLIMGPSHHAIIALQLFSRRQGGRNRTHSQPWKTYTGAARKPGG